MTREPRDSDKITIRDVANRAVVSIGTVSRVFNNYPNVETDLRLRVLMAAKELGYVPRRRERTPFQLEEGSNRERRISHLAFMCRAASGIGSVGALAQNPYFSVILHGVEAECRKQKIHMLYYVVEDAASELGAVSELLDKSGAEALILVNFINQDLVAGLLNKNVPAVLVDHYFPDLALDVVMNENHAGTVRAIRYLIQKGHCRIGFVDGLPHYTIDRRREGYRVALESAGIPYDSELVVPGDLTLEGGIRAAEIVVERKLDCTAYFCANDLSAIGFIQGLTRQGLKVPEDISVVGFDDIEAAKLVSPPLTTVKADAEQIGRLAVRRLLDRIKDPTLPITQTLLNSTLVERQSVKPLEIQG